MIKNRKLLLILFILSFSIFSCEKNKIIISDDLIMELSKHTFDNPTRHGNLLLFIPLENNEYSITHVNELYLIYKSSYEREYKTFESYLSEVLNQQIVLQKSKFLNRPSTFFKLDNEVTNIYNNSSIFDFKNKFCKCIEEDCILNVPTYSQDKNNTILYYFFINEYNITFDDYIGKYKITSSPA
jgi:hypothetical protein